MRHITPEWVCAMWNSNTGKFFAQDERANIKDEAFFEALYDAEVKRRLEISQNVSEVDAEALFTRLMKPYVDAGEMEKEEMDGRLSIINDYIKDNPNVPLKLDECRRQVDDIIDAGVENMRNTLPTYIIDRIADERVYALRVVSPHVAELLEDFRAKNEKYMTDGLRESREHDKRLAEAIGPGLLELLSLHDVKITDVCRRDGDVTFFLGDNNNRNEVLSIIFHDCDVRILDDIKDEWWLYEELDLRGDGKLDLCVICTDETRDSERVKRFAATVRYITVVQREGVLERQKAQKERVERLIAKGLVRWLG